MKKIKLLSADFGNKIFTRSIISNFFDKLKNFKEKEIVLDFKDIDFVSRSCADEYLKLKEKTSKKLVEENMSDAVCSMFKLVETQHKNSGITYSINSSVDKNSMIPV
ncbi:hypothetical protein KAT80_00295 [Candidatus Pacearchaeota archaeon]|nr:hypothetical protein [Candidatus Pacearchaeota archaeon]